MTPDPISPAPRRPSWWGPVGLAALVGAIFFFRLGDDVPLRSHEALVAGTARNMFLDRPVKLFDGSRPSPYLVPNFNDCPRLRKTPLPYWTVAGLAFLTGEVDEWSARLPSALAAAATVLLVMALVRRWSDRRAALWAGAALATAVGFLLLARMALADMEMTFFTTASVAAAWMAVETGGRRRMAWMVLAGAAAGLAMLAKGPAPALVLPAPFLVAAAIIVARLRRPRRKEDGGRAEWAWTLGGAAVGTLVFAAITLPWPVYVYLRVPQALEIWKAESVDRSTGDLGHEEPVWFYIVRLPMLVAPWTLFLAYGLVVAVKRWRREAADRAALAFVAAWFLGPLAAFSLCAGKQDHYILPILPAAAIYTAMAMRHLFGPSSPEAEQAGRRMLIGHGAAAGLLGLGGLAAYAAWRAWPTLYAGRLSSLAAPEVLGPAAVLGAIGVAGGAACVALAMRRRPQASAAALTAAFALAFLAAWAGLIGPMDRATTAAAFAAQVRREVPPEAPLLGFEGANNTVIYYSGRTIPIIGSAGAVETEIGRGPGFFLICPDSHRASLGRLPGLVPVAHEANRWRPGEGFWLLKSCPPAGAK